MMKKRNKLLIMLFLLFVGITSVRAEESVCTPSQLSKLRSAAANVKVTYMPVTDVGTVNQGNGEVDSSALTYRYLDVKIYNVSEELYVQVNNGNQKWSFNSNDIMADGSITIRQPASSTNTYNYVFEIVSYRYGCSLETLRTIRLTLPKFNVYSDLEICQDIPDYYLCQQYTTYSVDGSTFYNKVDEYKTKLLALEEEKISEENNSVITNSLSKISKYKYLVVGIIVVIGVVLTVIVLKKKGSVL